MQDKKAKQKLTLAVHKNILVMIAWFAADNVKHILRFGSTCKRFRECTQSPMVWFYLYAAKGYPINQDLLTSLDLAQKVEERKTIDLKWEYIRQIEEIKVDWEEQYKIQFHKTIQKKVNKFQNDYSKFFGKNPKRLPK